MEIAWRGLILNPQIKFKFKNNSLHVNILFSSWTCYLKVYFLSSICFWLFFCQKSVCSVHIELVLGFLLCSVVLSVDPYAQSMLSWAAKSCIILRPGIVMSSDLFLYSRMLWLFGVFCGSTWIFWVVLMMTLGTGILMWILVNLQTVWVVWICDNIAPSNRGAW